LSEIFSGNFVMVHLEASVQFSPNQVVCLEQEGLRLFGEVVQMVPLRSRCWVRPLAMAQVLEESLELRLLYDLRESSHLVLPAQLFREALDTELIPLMSVLFHPDKESLEESSDSESARQAIHQLIRQISVAQADAFRSVQASTILGA
jgi:hypothetical protein